MNRTIGSFLIALSASAVFAGCANELDAASAAATPDGIGTLTTAGSVSVVVSPTWAQTIGGPMTPGLGTAYALASSNAAALVASRPTLLNVSAKDAFVQGSVLSSGDVFYV